MKLQELINYARSMELSDYQAQQLGELLHKDRKHLNLLNAALKISISSGRISEACRGDLFEMAFTDKIALKNECQDLVLAVGLILKIIE